MAKRHLEGRFRRTEVQHCRRHLLHDRLQHVQRLLYLRAMQSRLDEPHEELLHRVPGRKRLTPVLARLL
jgi:hypothetical protein